MTPTSCVHCGTLGCAWCRATATDPRDAEIAGLRRLVESLAERVYLQSELLSRRAERPRQTVAKL